MTGIREAEPEDYDRLSAIQTTELSEPWPDLLEAAVAGPPVALVAEDDRPVGYAIGVVGDDAAYVPEIAIAPGSQGEGFGSDLLTALVDRLEDESVERVRLTARAEDVRARGFYESHGFDLIERLPDHFESGDGLLLERRLGD